MSRVTPLVKNTGGGEEHSGTPTAAKVMVCHEPGRWKMAIIIK